MGQAYQHFFFELDPDGGLLTDQKWLVIQYLPYLSLTNDHQYTGFDEIRSWLIEKRYPYEIDGVHVRRRQAGEWAGAMTPRQLDIMIVGEQRNLVLVKVADEIAPHFKMRWG